MRNWWKAKWRNVLALACWGLTSVGSGWLHVASHWLGEDHQGCRLAATASHEAHASDCECHPTGPQLVRGKHRHAESDPVQHLLSECSICVVAKRAVGAHTVFDWQLCTTISAIALPTSEDSPNFLAPVPQARGPPCAG